MSIDRGNDRPPTVHSLSCFCARETKTPIPANMNVNEVSENVKFDEDLKQALQESLSLFPVNELKAEQKLIIEQIVRKRDVFGQLPTGYGKSLTFQLLPGVLKLLGAEGHAFPANPLVIVISPLLSIVEDQVKYLKSLGIEAAYIGESKSKDEEILNGKGGFALLYGSPESLTGDEKFKAMFSKDFYQKNTVAVVCDEAHTAVHW